jgi:hypothetical protein
MSASPLPFRASCLTARKHLRAASAQGHAGCLYSQRGYWFMPFAHSDITPRGALSRLPPPNRACKISKHPALRGPAFRARDYPRVRIPFAFARCRGHFRPHRVSDYSGRLPPAPLRPVAGFPDLRLLRGLRRHPGFSSRLLGTSVSGWPPTFTLLGSTEEFRRRLASTT